MCACTRVHGEWEWHGSFLSNLSPSVWSPLPCPVLPLTWRSPVCLVSCVSPGYIQKIKSGEEDFESLASQFSDCSSAKARGDLGAFSRGVQVTGTAKAWGTLWPTSQEGLDGLVSATEAFRAQQVAVQSLPLASEAALPVGGRGDCRAFWCHSLLGWGVSLCFSLHSCPHHRSTKLPIASSFCRYKAGAPEGPRILPPTLIGGEPGVMGGRVGSAALSLGLSGWNSGKGGAEGTRPLPPPPPFCTFPLYPLIPRMQ